MASEPDYITINPAFKPDRYNVVVMRYRAATDEYTVYKSSHILTKGGADEIAKLWAYNMGLEIR